MNAYQRYTPRLQGTPVDRPPNFNIFMTFAAHHIRQPLSRYYLDHRVLVEANLAVLEDFELDLVQAISDPFRETADFGAEIRFPDDNLPLCTAPRLAEPEDLRTLVPPDPWGGGRMTDRLQAIAAFREQVGGEVPIMGWVEGALAQAADLRGVSNLLMDLILRPEWVEELLEVCSQTEVAFARAQVEAGADLVGLGDAVASQVSAEMYRRFALPYERRIFDAVHEAGGLARLHICGNTTHLLHDMPASGVDLLDLDWMVDLGHAAQWYAQGGPALCGNFDPTAILLQGTPGDVARATRACLEQGGPCLLSMAGCEVPDGTPHENLHAQTRVLHEWGNA